MQNSVGLAEFVLIVAIAISWKDCSFTVVVLLPQVGFRVEWSYVYSIRTNEKIGLQSAFVPWTNDSIGIYQLQLQLAPIPYTDGNKTHGWRY